MCNCRWDLTPERLGYPSISIFQHPDVTRYPAENNSEKRTSYQLIISAWYTSQILRCMDHGEPVLPGNQPQKQAFLLRQHPPLWILAKFTGMGTQTTCQPISNSECETLMLACCNMDFGIYYANKGLRSLSIEFPGFRLKLIQLLRLGPWVWM
jgi:hypothetical protein